MLPMKQIQTTDNQGNEIVSSPMTQFKTNNASKSCKDGTLLTVSFNLRLRNRITPENNTSPNPSKGGEFRSWQVCNGFNQGTVPLLWRGRGGQKHTLLRHYEARSNPDFNYSEFAIIKTQACCVLRRLKSAVNKVSSLRDWLGRVA